MPTYLIQGKNLTHHLSGKCARIVDNNTFTIHLIAGNEFKALFMSTTESLDPSGCSNNPTKSLCSPSVFNTAITRAKSLVVAVGNPYTLMAVEEKLNKSKQCWAKYLNQCFSANTILKSPGITDGAVQGLQQLVKQKLNELPPKPSATPSPSVQKEGIESSSTHVQKKSPAPVTASSSSQIQTNSSVPKRPPVQSQQAVSKVASSPVKEKTDTFMVVNSFTPTGRDTYVELSLHGATSQNTTIKTTGPFPDRSQALSNPHSKTYTHVDPNISQMKDSGCVLCLPPQHQPGVFAVTVSSGANRGMFLLNVFDANAIKIVKHPVKSKVGQKQQWVADCTQAGPGILDAIASNKNTRTRTTVKYSPVSGLHTISFSPTEAGPYTLEVTYNGHGIGNTLRFNVQQ